MFCEQRNLSEHALVRLWAAQYGCASGEELFQYHLDVVDHIRWAFLIDKLHFTLTLMVCCADCFRIQ